MKQAIFVIFALLVGCGGQAVLSDDSPDASVDAANPDTGTQPDVDQPDAPAQDVGQPDVAPKPWDHKCACKNWTDEEYPLQLYLSGIPNCVTTTPCPSGTVCCAAPCLSPDKCVWGGFKTKVDCSHDHRKNWCCEHYTYCVPEDQCAPEGVLVFGTPYNPDTVNLPMCIPDENH